MIPAALRAVPAGLVDVTAPVTIDGLSHVDPDDPAIPMYRVIANNRQPVALRGPGVHPEEHIACQTVAIALAGPFGRAGVRA